MSAPEWPVVDQETENALLIAIPVVVGVATVALAYYWFAPSYASSTTPPPPATGLTLSAGVIGTTVTFSGQDGTETSDTVSFYTSDGTFQGSTGVLSDGSFSIPFEHWTKGTWEVYAVSEKTGLKSAPATFVIA